MVTFIMSGHTEDMKKHNKLIYATGQSHKRRMYLDYSVNIIIVQTFLFYTPETIIQFDVSCFA